MFPRVATRLQNRDAQIESLVNQLFNRLVQRREAFIQGAKENPTILLDLLDLEEELADCLKMEGAPPELNQLREAVTAIVEKVLAEADDAA